MDSNEFARQYKQSCGTQDLKDIVYDEFVIFCEENNFSVEELSEQDLMELTDEFVDGGFESLSNDSNS